jgi:hypothetical protein
VNGTTLQRLGTDGRLQHPHHDGLGKEFGHQCGAAHVHGGSFLIVVVDRFLGF